MAAVKKLTLKKLKRKSFWPSVIMFLVFATVSITLVFAGLQLLSNYILGARLSTACSQAMDTGIVMERCMNEKNDLTYAVNYVSQFREEPNNVYITDKLRNAVVHTSENAPDLNRCYIVNIGDTYELYPDKNGTTSGMLQDVNILEVMQRAFYDDPMDASQDRGAWMRETVIAETFWVKAHWNVDQYTLYVEKTIELQRQDIYYVSRLGVITLVILLIPLIFLFINTVTNIYTQRATAKLLYTDAVTGGHNWIYFQGTASETRADLMHSWICIWYIIRIMSTATAATKGKICLSAWMDSSDPVWECGKLSDTMPGRILDCLYAVRAWMRLSGDSIARTGCGHFWRSLPVCSRSASCISMQAYI